MSRSKKENQPRIVVIQSEKFSDGRSSAELTEALQTELNRALKERGFVVLPDRDAPHRKGPLEHRISDPLLTCDAGIVLISRDAIKSKWVQLKTAILYRRQAASNNKIRLLFVLLPDVKDAEIKRILRPFDTTDMVFLRLESAGEDEKRRVAIEVQSCLWGLERSPSNEDEKSLFRIFRDRLRGPQLTDLNHAIPGCAPHGPEENFLAEAAAKQLLALDLPLGTRRLRVLEEVIETLDSLEIEFRNKIFFRALPFCWVEPEDALCLPVIASGVEKVAAIAWERHWELSELMYLKRGFSGIGPFRIVKTHPQGGSVSKLLSHVQSCLSQALLDSENAPTSRIRNAIARHLRNGRPIFVVVPIALFGSKTLSKLIGAWPDVSFFLFFSTQDLDNQYGLEERLKELEVPRINLDPTLELQANSVWADYVHARDSAT